MCSITVEKEEEQVNSSLLPFACTSTRLLVGVVSG